LQRLAAEPPRAAASLADHRQSVAGCDRDTRVDPGEPEGGLKQNMARFGSLLEHRCVAAACNLPTADLLAATLDNRFTNRTLN